MSQRSQRCRPATSQRHNVINDITVYGWDQTVLYKNGAPIVWDRGRELGMTNRINQVPA